MDYWMQHLRPSPMTRMFESQKTNLPIQPSYRNKPNAHVQGQTKLINIEEGDSTANDVVSPELKAKLKELQDAADGVESLIARQLVDSIQRAAPSFSAGPMASLASDAFAEAMSKNLAKSGSFGISKALFDQFSQAVIDQQNQKTNS